MDISQKIAELEAEKERISQKIALLRELDDTIPSKAPVPSQRSSGEEIAKSVNASSQVISKRVEGKKIITEEYIGGAGTLPPGSFYGK